MRRFTPEIGSTARRIVGYRLLAAAVCLTLLAGSAELSYAQQKQSSQGSILAFRVQFGVTDTEPTDWSGSLSVRAGTIAQLRNWRPRPGDQIDGTTGWRLKTREGPQRSGLDTYNRLLSLPFTPYVTIPGLIVYIEALNGTAVTFDTQQGRFVVLPSELGVGKLQGFLDGAVTVDRVPAAKMISDDDYHDDFVTLLGGPEETLWTAWIGYSDPGDRIHVRRWNGESWAAIPTPSQKPGDLFWVKLGRDRLKRVWAVWSEQVEGNWDLYGRQWDGDNWSSTERLTNDPQPDAFHTLATDANGVLWLVWQAFRQGQADILARRFDGTEWSAVERVSSSTANDWEPAIATDSAGTVHIGWDTYGKGNYDVIVRSFSDGSWSEPLAVASTARYEAYVSLECDDQDRLWAVWKQSGAQWGKDTGFRILKQGTRLYDAGSIGMAIREAGVWKAPVADINRSLPENLEGFNDHPRLQVDGDGRMWVFFRHRLLRFQKPPNTGHWAAWEIWGTSYEGDRWTTPLHVPFSGGRQDMRWGLAASGDGRLYAAWPTDQRDYEEFLFQEGDVYAARLPVPKGPVEPAKLKRRVTAPLIKASPIHANEPLNVAAIRKYRIESGGKTYRIYRGDTHRHTEFSFDGNKDGSLLQAYRYALDAASLDYLGVSEHIGRNLPDGTRGAAGALETDYYRWIGQKTVDLLTLPGSFVPLYVYERSARFPNGHRNILFAERGNPGLPIPPEEQQGPVPAAALYNYLRRYNGISIPHTPTGSGTDWRENDPSVEPLVEIYQGMRSSAEYEGAPRAQHRNDPLTGPPRSEGFVWNAWAKGHKIGIQASSDHYSTHVSYACTIAEEFTREGLLDAMRKRHSYGATDNIVLDYRLKTDEKEYLQGDVAGEVDGFKLWVNVIGTAAIRQIDIIKNNTFVHTRQNLGREVNFTFVDNEQTAGESYYYVRVQQIDGQLAWSSPIWVAARQ